MNDLLLKISDYYKDNRASALCIITKNSGSVPGKIGAKMIVFSDGSIEGTVGGGAIEKQIISDALHVILAKTPVFRAYDLEKELAMACGGSVSVYIEPLTKPSKLYIFGAGHIGKYLAQYAPDLGFETTLIDWRNDLFEKSGAIRYLQVCKPYLEAINDISFDLETYIVIVTPGHDMDEEVLAAVGKKSAAYVGLIGSKKKIATLIKRFLEENILSEPELNRVDMPIGIKFNAITPPEIAISILAKLIDVKNSVSAK